MSTSKRIGQFWIPLAWIVATTAPACGDLVIAKDRMATSAIVVGQTPSEPEKRAAAELQHYLQQISGALIPVCADGTSGTERRILMGTPASNPAIAGLLKNQTKRLSDLGEEGFLLKQIGTDLIITANSGRGVLYGTYDFLEKDLDCRWYLPGELGEVIPQRDTIILGKIDRTEKPSLLLRNLHIVGAPGQYDRTIADWMSRNRINAKKTNASGVNDILAELKPRAIDPYTGVHAFAWFVPAHEYFGEHPEYFPLIRGRRANPGAAAMGYQLCLANPEVQRIFLDKAKRYLANHPDVRCFGLCQNDGDGWCECEKCLAMGRSPTDRYVAFVNIIARQIGAAYPDTLIPIMAYGQVTDPPSVRPLDNVVADIYAQRCFPHRLDDPRCPTNVKVVKIIRGWQAMVKPRRLLWGDLSDDPEYLPRSTARTISQDLRWLASEKMAGFIGLIMPISLENMKLYTYAVARMSWNPQRRYDELLDEFCAKYYGNASSEMNRYFRILDERAEKHPDCQRWGTAAQHYFNLLPPAVLKQLGAHLDKAQVLARGDEKAERRVAAEKKLYRQYVDYLTAIAGRDDIEEGVQQGKISNLVANAGFENWPATMKPITGKQSAQPDRHPQEILLEQGWTNEWIRDTNEGTGTFDIVEGAAPEGNKYIRITCANDKSYLRIMQVVKLKKGHTYYFSVRVKADEGVSGPIWLNQDHPAGLDKIAWYSSTRGNWQKVVIPEFTAARDTGTIILENRFPKLFPGSVSFEDVIFVDVTEMEK